MCKENYLTGESKLTSIIFMPQMPLIYKKKKKERHLVFRKNKNFNFIIKNFKYQSISQFKDKFKTYFNFY